VRNPSRSNTTRAASISRARVRTPFCERGPIWFVLSGARVSLTTAFGTGILRVAVHFRGAQSLSIVVEIDVELNFVVPAGDG
jgi:hypothetical protein